LDNFFAKQHLNLADRQKHLAPAISTNDKRLGTAPHTKVSRNQKGNESRSQRRNVPILVLRKLEILKKLGIFVKKDFKKVFQPDPEIETGNTYF